MGSRPALVFAYDPAVTERVFSDADKARLAAACNVLSWEPLTGFDTDAARNLLAQAEVLVSAWGTPRLSSEAVSAAPNLRLVAHAAGTVKSQFSPEAFEAGIRVTSAVEANALPVAEFTLAAILFAGKRILGFRDLYRETRASVRTHPWMASDLGNYRKTIGLIGASRIGRRVIELLQPFDFTLLLHDPYVTPAEAAALGTSWVELDDLLAASDIVSLHAPSTPETRHLLDARRLGLLRDGATFINTARGAIVDQQALVRELVAGRIEAVIDVTEPEVLPATSPLYDLPNVLLLPHIAGSVGGERARLGTMVVDEVLRYAAGEPLRHQLDYATLSRQA